MRSLATRAIRGVAWTIATSLGSRALGMIGTLLLVRWVAPEEYGVVGVAAVVMMTASQVSTLGAGVYVIAHPSAGRAVAFHATVIHLVLGLLVLGGTLAVGPWLAPWFDAPALMRFLPGMALSVLLDRVTFMPERVLARDLRFGRRAAARSVGELAYTFVSVGAAVAGAGGMAVVWGNLARSALRMIVMVASVDRREWIEPHPISGPTLRTLSSYGSVILVGASCQFGCRYWDNAMVAHLFGPAVMSAYQLAYNLADVPAVQVGEHVGDVLLPSFVRMEPELRPAALLRSMALLGLLVFPLAVGLGAVSSTVGDVLFPKQWAGVGGMLMLLSGLSVPRPVAGALAAYLVARDRTRPLMLLDAAQLALLLGGIATVGALGPLWTCGVVGVVFAARAIANMWLVRAVDGIPIRRFLARLAPPLAACIPLVAGVLAARWGLARAGVGGRVLPLLGEVAGGAAGYTFGALVIARTATRDLLDLTRRTLLRRSPGAAAASG